MAVQVSSKANALFSSARPQFESYKYFESPHGKEAMNGLGDIKKRTVFRNIKVNKAVIDYVKRFAEYANQIGLVSGCRVC